MRPRDFTVLAVVCVTVCMLCVACTPSPPKTQPASERQKPSADAAAISLEAAPGPEHNVFMKGKMPVVHLRLRNASAREVSAPIQWVVTDFRGKEVHRSSETVKLAPVSAEEKEFLLPLKALGYFEAAFTIDGKTAKAPLVVLPDKPGVKLQAGALAGWPASRAGADPRAQAGDLTRTYLEQMSKVPPRPVHWDSSASAGPLVPSPEMVAQRTVASLLEGATFRRKIETGPVHARRFFKDGGKGPTWAIWCTAPCGPVALRPLDGPVLVTDLMGNTVGLKPRYDMVILIPAEAPTFVTLFTKEVMGVTPMVSVVEPPQKLYAGEAAQIAVEIWNPFRDPLKATVSVSLPAGWSGSAAPAAVKVEEGAKERVAVKFVPAAESKPGPTTIRFSINLGRPELPAAELPVTVQVQRRESK